MSVRVDLAEFLTAYLAEVQEQLSIANGRILAVEESLSKGEANPRAVRDLFRALHTIKGLSAMVGVEPVVVVAHRMEAVLRRVDRAGGKLPGEALEPIVEGIRAIEERVRALAAMQPVPPPSGALLAALDALDAGTDASAPTAPLLDLEPSLAGKLVAFEKQQLLRGIEEGRRAVQIEFIPSAERAALGHSINRVRDRLAAIAELVKVIPVALSPNERAPSGLAFVLLLVTNASDGQLAEAAAVEPTSVRSILLKESIRPPGPAALTPTPPEPDSELPDETIERRNLLRVDVSRVDDAMDRLGSLMVSRSRLARAIAALPASSSDTRELRQVSSDLARQLRDLRSSLLQVRMVSVSEVLERVPLVVRALKRATGKSVRLEIDAGGAELDKAVADRIFPALLQLVRNAVDHGIEDPQERRAAGKPEEGLVRITAFARSNTQLEILVSDDGRGVDRARVAARAGADVPTSDPALLDLLCRPGVSSRDEVTTTSGRGMGMDIVRRIVVDQLGGELLLTTRPGVGTSFALHIPLTIAIVDAFIVQCATERFVLPVAAVEEILETSSVRLVAAPMRVAFATTHLGIFERRGETVPLLDLASLLRLPPSGEAPRRALVVRRAGQPVAFGLDYVLGQQEAVVRPLLDPLVNVPGVAGATDLGDGRPTLVLDLVAFAGMRPARGLVQGARVPALPSALQEGSRV